MSVPREPKSGEVLWVTAAASVQFGPRPILFRVIRVHDWTTYEDWMWIDGYELNSDGDAVERRSIFVQPLGLRWVDKAPDPRTRNTRRTRNTGRAAVPRPRTTTESTSGRTR